MKWIVLFLVLVVAYAEADDEAPANDTDVVPPDAGPPSGDGNLQVDCTTIQVTITLLDANNANLQDIDNMHAGPVSSDLCNGVLDADGNLVFTFSPADCGAALSSDADNIIFSYDIFAGEVSADDGKPITRKLKPGGMAAQCYFVRNAVVDADFRGGVSVVNFVGSENGFFEFFMELQDEDGNTIATGSDVQVGEPVIAQIDFNAPDDDLMMFVQSCTAFADSEGEGPSYPLIVDRCFTDDTTLTPGSDTGKTFSFGFDAFVFVESDGSMVYITCDIYVCLSTDAGIDTCQFVGSDCGETDAKRSLLKKEVNFAISSALFQPIQ